MENNFIVNNNDSFFKCRKLDPYLSNHKGYIAGGCFKDIFMNRDKTENDSTTTGG
jgi:hypothetical protein